MKNIYLAIILILVLLILFMCKNENFISFMASTLSDYGPETPFLILTKYIPDANNGKIYYPELEKYTKALTVLEIYTNQTYKLYSDDGFVREGMVPGYLWEQVKILYEVAPGYNNSSFCNFTGRGLTNYYMWINGYLIDLGLFLPGCVPYELYRAKQLFDLMEFSDISH